jgi:hypothetical protein
MNISYNYSDSFHKIIVTSDFLKNPIVCPVAQPYEQTLVYAKMSCIYEIIIKLRNQRFENYKQVGKSDEYKDIFFLLDSNLKLLFEARRKFEFQFFLKVCQMRIIPLIKKLYPPDDSRLWKNFNARYMYINTIINENI